MDAMAAFSELGVGLEASMSDVKSAYRSLAKKWHPDINQSHDANGKMKTINVAYEEVTRQIKIRDAAAAANKARMHGQSKQHNSSWNGSGAGFSGNGWTANAADNSHFWEAGSGKIITKTIKVTMFEAAFGCIKRLNGGVVEKCARCGGVGHPPGTEMAGTKCMKCLGIGNYAERGHSGAKGKILTCDACNGTGIYKGAIPVCGACKGTGKTSPKVWEFDLVIPPGTLDGKEFVVSGISSKTGNRDLLGNIRIIVKIHEHPIFKLEGEQLTVMVPVSIWKWYLGGDMLIPTLNGCITISIPARAEKIRVKEHGWPMYKDAERFHPLYVIPRVIHPESQTEEDRLLLHALDEKSRLPEVEGWKTRVELWMEAGVNERFRPPTPKPVKRKKK